MIRGAPEVSAAGARQERGKAASQERDSWPPSRNSVLLHVFLDTARIRSLATADRDRLARVVAGGRGWFGPSDGQGRRLNTLAAAVA